MRYILSYCPYLALLGGMYVPQGNRIVDATGWPLEQHDGLVRMRDDEHYYKTIPLRMSLGDTFECICVSIRPISAACLGSGSAERSCISRERRGQDVASDRLDIVRPVHS